MTTESPCRPFCQNVKRCPSKRRGRHCKPCGLIMRSATMQAKPPHPQPVRSHCEAPDACKAKGKRHCHPCGMKKTLAEKPELLAALIERSKNLHLDPAYQAKHKQIFNRRHRLPDECRQVVKSLISKGYRVKEAAAIVRRDLVKGA